ncbi:TetR/AcrR family transcriptional regulator [Endozoicomonas sp.]|uniref:TetR/AcrR family transcriptional regulator n=1 Tax=Endozoicomonas sp. TaxID=1892382 RepID=UPI002887D278|nr:TetR family transcriptional regulator [Endozoicomonas sp.]
MDSPSEDTKDSGKHTSGMALKYQGRKTSRANSEQRRRTILEAALRIVVRDGVRGVRHRAVAKEANVPLSATTYYFKDITDLITDTFTLFVEMGAEKFKAYWEESDSMLKMAMSELEPSNSGSRQVFAERIADLAIEYVLVQLREHCDYLIAERAFQQECLRNENLRPIAFSHQKFFLNSLEAFFSRIGSNHADIDAELFGSVILHVEYQGLIAGFEGDNLRKLRAMLKRQIELTLGIYH